MLHILIWSYSTNGVAYETCSVWVLRPWFNRSSIGIVAPYYVEYTPDVGGGITTSAPYDPSILPAQITGTGRLFQGLGESNIVIGGNIKAALNFEIGTIKSQVTGFETGILIDAYTKTIEMMPATKNYSVYPTLFITLFYGSRK